MSPRRSLPAILPCLIALLSCTAARAAEDAFPTLEPIAELSPDRLQQSYRRLVLKLADAPPGGEGLQLTIGLLGAKPVQIWALAPRWGSQRLISRSGSLAWDGSRLSGTAYVLIANPFVDKAHYKAHKNGGAWWSLEIDASESATGIDGTYRAGRSNKRAEPAPVSGTLTGHSVDRATIDERHPPQPAADFPCWRGRYGNGTAPGVEQELVADLGQASVLWTSEESDLPGTYNIVMGGLGGPVVADGKVFLSYQMPNGPTFDEEWATKLMPAGPAAASRISYYGHRDGETGARWLRRRTSVEADDVVLCIDAQTGLTRWKRVWPAAARNPSYSGRGWSWAKNGPFTTPCIVGERLYTIGGHGALYCLDTNDGATVWTAELPSASAAAAHLDAAVAAGRMVQRTSHKPRAPDLCTSLAHAQGVIVANDNGWAVHGWDAATGAKRWGPVKIDGLGGGRSGGAHSGVPIMLDGKQMLIMGPALLDPRDGTVLWSVPAAYFRGELGNAAVAGDVVVFANGTKNEDSEVGVSAWRLDAAGDATLLWTLDRRYCTAGFQSPAIYANRLYCCTRPGRDVRDEHAQGQVICVDMETGRILASVERRRGEGSIAQLLADDGRLLVGQQHASWWSTDPDDFRRLSPFPGGDSVPNNQSSHPQALCGGRLYSRGDFNLVCWDLRRTRAPRFAPPSGQRDQALQLQITHPDPNAVLRYAFDGAEPTDASPVFTGPLSIEATRIVKARAHVPGKAPSPVVEAVYYFGDADSALPPVVSPQAGAYQRELTITLETDTRYAEIHYTLDGSEPTVAAPRYDAPFILARSATLKAKTFCDYLPDSEVVAHTYRIDRQPFLARGDHIVIEAENYFCQKQAENHAFAPVEHGGASAQAIDAQPDNGTKYKQGHGPRLDFPILVEAPGEWYAWVRWQGRGGSSDSFYLGVDTQVLGEFGRHGGDWIWQRLEGNVSFERDGQHVLNIWMREDGTLIDKLVLTRDADWQPTGTGPAQSPQR